MLAPVCFYRTTLIISSSEFHKFAEMWHSLALEKNKSKNTVLCCIFCVCVRARVRNTRDNLQVLFCCKGYWHFCSSSLLDFCGLYRMTLVLQTL